MHKKKSSGHGTMEAYIYMFGTAYITPVIFFLIKISLPTGSHDTNFLLYNQHISNNTRLAKKFFISKSWSSNLKLLAYEVVNHCVITLYIIKC